MGVKSINKLIVPILLLILLSNFVLSAGVAVEDTSILTQLNERLEKQKAEIIKAIRDAQAQNQNTTSAFIDENFKTLDQRMQEFFKSSKRDIALIMVAGFLIGFALSQIIRLTIERSRRRALIKKGQELEMVVQKLEKEAFQLSMKVKQLQSLDLKYSEELKRLTKKQPFITLNMVLFGIVTLLLGVIVTYLLMGGK
jgi:flagellar biosynthesis/type III secretory pathway M-ring protein FliF/YscJ